MVFQALEIITPAMPGYFLLLPFTISYNRLCAQLYSEVCEMAIFGILKCHKQ